MVSPRDRSRVPRPGLVKIQVLIRGHPEPECGLIMVFSMLLSLSRKPTQFYRILRLANDLLESWPTSGFYLANELAHGCDGADIAHSRPPPRQASRWVAQDVADKHAGRVHGKRGDVGVERLFLRVIEIGFDIGDVKHR